MDKKDMDKKDEIDLRFSFLLRGALAARYFSLTSLLSFVCTLPVPGTAELRDLLFEFPKTDFHRWHQDDFHESH
jgi:hypothetical protein